jgi:hypothetical protein
VLRSRHSIGNCLLSWYLCLAAVIFSSNMSMGVSILGIAVMLSESELLCISLVIGLSRLRLGGRIEEGLLLRMVAMVFSTLLLGVCFIPCTMPTSPGTSVTLAVGEIPFILSDAADAACKIWTHEL